MKKSIKLKYKHKPVEMTKDVWFYQNQRSLQFVVWQTGYDGKRICTQFRLPLKKLGI